MLCNAQNCQIVENELLIIYDYLKDIYIDTYILKMPYLMKKICTYLLDFNITIRNIKVHWNERKYKEKMQNIHLSY